nr:UDP-2,3-diacylglucosamine diphosphatase [Gammaproteobacteria bacterium]
MQPLHYRAIFLSDIHLGTRGAQGAFLLDFLTHTSSKYLYLVGDILDLWKMKNGWYWPRVNNEIVRLVFDKAQNGTRVIYVPGNHDDLLRDLAGSEFNGIHIQQEAIHETADGKKMLVLHGDEFDSIVKHNRWLAVVGSGAYEALLVANRWFNSLRRRWGFPYWSLSAYVKHRVKNAVQFISSFERVVTLEATRRRVDGLICGHIHKATVEKVGEVLYANSGDWVESCTALVEDDAGDLRILRWVDESAHLLDQRDVYETHRRRPNLARADERQWHPQ